LNSKGKICRRTKKNKIIKDFGPNHLTAIELVEGFEAEEGLSTRITRCIVHLAKGDLKSLHSAIQRAKHDWRDVILWAEATPFEFNHPFGSPENKSRANFDKLKEFIVEQVGVEENEVTPYARLYEDLGVYGDDATDLLINYRDRFNVDVSKFMAADYFKGEGTDVIGGLIRLFSGKQSGGLKTLTVNDLGKGIVAGRLDEEVIAGANDDTV
jgi:acyl carrier protein